MPPVRLELDVTFAARRPWTPARAQFLRWVNATLAQAGARQRLPRGTRRVALSVQVVGAARSRTLNARYRRKDRPTNVLSFRGAGSMPDGSADLGELVICTPVVAQEAGAQGKRASAHWAHLTVHGVLHLLGFDHEDPAGSRLMESREVRILERLGFSDPYTISD